MGEAALFVRRMLYIADSESSSVRQVSLTDGAVKALVGATREPQVSLAAASRWPL